MKYEIRVAGFGGQGVITAGYVLANAVSLHDTNHAIMSQSYGPEARGGSCKSDIIISNEPIDYPKTGKIDCLITLSIGAYHTFRDSVKKKGIIIYEKNLVKIPEKEFRKDVTYYGIPAVETARELGNVLVANMVILGAFQAITGRIHIEALKESVRERFPRHIDFNLHALEKGVELGKAYI